MIDERLPLVNQQMPIVLIYIDFNEAVMFKISAAKLYIIKKQCNIPLLLDSLYMTIIGQQFVHQVSREFIAVSMESGTVSLW